MNVSLTPELEKFVATQVETGHYRSASEVIREALRNNIRQSMADKLSHRLALSRQQITEGKFIVADADYFESKRQRLKKKFSK